MKAKDPADERRNPDLLMKFVFSPVKPFAYAAASSTETVSSCKLGLKMPKAVSKLTEKLRASLSGGNLPRNLGAVEVYALQSLKASFCSKPCKSAQYFSRQIAHDDFKQKMRYAKGSYYDSALAYF